MKSKSLIPALALWLVASCVSAAEVVSIGQRSWPHWRGPAANGVALQADPPIHWNEKTNIKWKVAIEGEGSATPIVWGDRIFVATAVRTDRVAEERPQADADARTEPPGNYYEFVLLCLELETGRVLWRQVACEAVPHEGRHTTNTYASGSPVTDGQRVYVSFGSRGVYGFDMDGKRLWQRDLGQMRTRRGWGEASTPALHGERLVVNWDHEDQSFIVVLDAQTGETRWKLDRDEPTSWATPLIVEHAGRVQAIVNGTTRVRSYDLETGEIIWQCGGQTVNAIPTPLVVDDVVFCLSGYRGAAAYAIPLSAQGDVTGTPTVRWTHHRGTPYVPSPIVVGDQMYFTASNTAVLTSLDIKTGALVFGPTRIPGLSNIYASPAAAAGRIYFVGREGTTVVLKAGPELEVLATNALDDPIDASPVLVGNRLLLRGQRHLYCVEAE